MVNNSPGLQTCVEKRQFLGGAVRRLARVRYFACAGRGHEDDLPIIHLATAKALSREVKQHDGPNPSNTPRWKGKARSHRQAFAAFAGMGMRPEGEGPSRP